jgi:hypothetical protein
MSESGGQRGHAYLVEVGHRVVGGGRKGEIDVGELERMCQGVWGQAAGRASPGARRPATRAPS